MGVCARAHVHAHTPSLPLPSLCLRNQEWLPSTPKHLMLYDALGWKRPTVRMCVCVCVCVCVCACACVCARACALAHPPTGAPRPTCADTTSARQFAHLPLLLNPDKTKLSKR